MQVRALPIVSALLVALCLMPEVVAAQASEAEPAALNWVRLAEARDCLDAQTLAQRVEQRIGHPIFVAPSQTRLFIEGTVTHGVEGYAAKLELFDTSGRALGSREVKSNKADCTELGDTVVLVLAVMVDPESVLRLAPDAPKDIAPPPEPVVSKPKKTPQNTEKAAPPPATPKARERSADVSLYGRVGWGMLPNAAFGVGVSGSFEAIANMLVRVEATGYAESEAELSTAGGGGARLRLLTAGAQFCPLAALKPEFGFYGCAGVEAGVLQNRAFDLSQSEKDSSDPIVNAVARIGADFRILSPVRVMIGTNLVVPTLRTQYQATALDGSTEKLFEAKAIGVSADVGIGTRF